MPCARAPAPSPSLPERARCHPCPCPYPYPSCARRRAAWTCEAPACREARTSAWRPGVRRGGQRWLLGRRPRGSTASAVAPARQLRAARGCASGPQWSAPRGRMTSHPGRWPMLSPKA
eukprot:7037111-Prymnesium_polylepis.1